MHGKEACGPKRAQTSWKKGSFGAQASESRSLCPIFAQWAQKVLVLETSPDKVRALGLNFLDLVEVIELVEISAK
eukprot:3314978-Amphidinium_carterae.1